jgi:hypothetical protein
MAAFGDGVLEDAAGQDTPGVQELCASRCRSLQPMRSLPLNRGLKKGLKNNNLLLQNTNEGHRMGTWLAVEPPPLRFGAPMG